MRLSRKQRRILRRQYQRYAATENLAMKARLREAGREIRRRGLSKSAPAALAIFFKAVYGGVSSLMPPEPASWAALLGPTREGPAPGALLAKPLVVPARPR